MIDKKVVCHHVQ